MITLLYKLNFFPILKKYKSYNIFVFQMILKINFEEFSNITVKICLKHTFMRVFEKTWVFKVYLKLLKRI
jgi:hypothetical protein